MQIGPAGPRFSEQGEPPVNLTPRQQQYLDLLQKWNGSTVAQVAIHFEVSGSAAAAMLKRLVALGVATEDRGRKTLVYRAVA